MLTGLATALGVLALSPPAMALSRPRDLAGAALHPWRLETRSYAPLWPLRDPALRGKTFRTLRQAGIRRARVDLQWSSVEPNRPIVPRSSPIRDWSEFDATVASAYTHGIKLEPVVSFTPSWANGGRGPFAFPTDPYRFQDFMTEAMRRYPHIHAWEIWNEPNTVRFSPPRPDPAKFVAILRAAGRARAWARSGATLISGGLAPDREADVTDFAVKIARLGAFRYVDALGVHPYSWQHADEPGSSFLKLPKAHARVSEAAGRSIPFWVTEYGYPNSPRRTSYGPPTNERGQAMRLKRAFALAVGWPWIRRLTWYGFRDDCSDASHPDCRFGLLRENFAAKQSWHAYLDVLDGRLPRLDTTVTIHRRSKVVRKRKRRRRVLTLLGGLRMPGTDPARGKVVVTATRRYGRYRRRRRITTQLVEGRYRVSLRRLRRGRWRFRARFEGDRRYAPSASRVLRARVRKPRR